jgi:uncharacterized membrane protein (UPF0127 family)
MAIKKLLIILAVVVALGAAAFVLLLVLPPQSMQTVRVNGVDIQVEVVDTVAKQQQGLSGRTSLAEGSGMLFAFQTDDIWAMWMKDMNFSIDMLWAQSDGTIVKIERNASPESYPSVFASEVPARFVLEVPAGFTTENGIEEGMRMEIFK